MPRAVPASAYILSPSTPLSKNWGLGYCRACHGRRPVVAHSGDACGRAGRAMGSYDRYLGTELKISAAHLLAMAIKRCAGMTASWFAMLEMGHLRCPEGLHVRISRGPSPHSVTSCIAQPVYSAVLNPHPRLLHPTTGGSLGATAMLGRACDQHCSCPSLTAQLKSAQSLVPPYDPWHDLGVLLKMLLLLPPPQQLHEHFALRVHILTAVLTAKPRHGCVRETRAPTSSGQRVIISSESSSHVCCIDLASRAISERDWRGKLAFPPMTYILYGQSPKLANQAGSIIGSN
jgi:hypothetical protein